MASQKNYSHVSIFQVQFQGQIRVYSFKKAILIPKSANDHLLKARLHLMVKSTLLMELSEQYYTV